MPRIELKADAQQDLDEVAAYIAQNNLDVALRFSQAAQETFEQLARHPGLGAPRDYRNPDLAGMRMRPIRGFEKYLIFYRPIEDGVEIIRILHGRRDIESLFRATE